MTVPEYQLWRNHFDKVVLNHAEMVHRPGEREAAKAFFETLGFATSELGPWMMILIHPDTSNGVDNTMYCNEASPAQQRFEDALTRSLERDAELAASLEHYRSVRMVHPQYNFHFGVTFPTHEEWQRRSDRIVDASRNHPLLAGRVEVAVLEPGHPSALGPQSQTFIQTDIVAAGSLALGLLFELQWTPVDANGVFGSNGGEGVDYFDVSEIV
jgi:hypothetical protein